MNLAPMLCAALLVAGSPAPVRERLAALVQQAEARDTTVVAGQGGFLFFVPELRHLSLGPFWGDAAVKTSRATKPEDADPLPAILDFKAQLDKAGIELLFVPVPAKAAIYADKLPRSFAGEVRELGGDDRAFRDVLRNAGVPVLDLDGVFRSHRDAGPPLYCRQDSHWSGAGIAVAAHAIAGAIADRPWLAATARRPLASQETEVVIKGDLWQALKEPRPPPETLKLRVIGEKTPDGVAPLKAWRESPVLLLGDSHALVFHEGGDMHAVGAGLADQLALELSFAVDLVAVRGSGATPSRINLLRRGDGLSGKKLVIWCLSVREYSEGQGWKKLPIGR